MAKRVLMPMASCGSDPSELSIPWLMLTRAGHTVAFATPDGKKGQGDPRMLSGQGLGPWRPILRANAEARAAYAEMELSNAFSQPLAYAAWGRVADWDALLLPGGHDKPIRAYLESADVHGMATAFFAAKKTVAAICHGVLVVGRAKDAASGKSLLYGRKTTSLTNGMERSAHNLTRLWLGDYYRTYAATTEDEVRSYLARPEDYDAGPMALRRDSLANPERGFVVKDGAYLSARWPGDAHRFAETLLAMLAD